MIAEPTGIPVWWLWSMLFLIAPLLFTFQANILDHLLLMNAMKSPHDERQFPSSDRESGAASSLYYLALRCVWSIL
jgi:hypothetical protein